MDRNYYYGIITAGLNKIEEDWDDLVMRSDDVDDLLSAIRKAKEDNPITEIEDEQHIEDLFNAIRRLGLPIFPHDELHYLNAGPVLADDNAEVAARKESAIALKKLLEEDARERLLWYFGVGTYPDPAVKRYNEENPEEPLEWIDTGANLSENLNLTQRRVKDWIWKYLIPNITPISSKSAMHIPNTAACMRCGVTLVKIPN